MAMATAHGGRERAASEPASQVEDLSDEPKMVQLEVAKLLARLRRRQLTTDSDVARKTLELMRLVVVHNTAKDVSALISSIKRVGAVLVASQPHQLAIGNMVRRVLWVVREETAEDGGFRAAAADAAPAVATAADSAAVSAATDGGASSVGRSLREMLDAPSKVDYSRQSAKDLKKPIHASISELIDELSAVPEHIAEQAIEHIHANEVVLTHGHDASVEAFLRAAHKKRPFELVVAETAPSYEGRATAAAMASLGVQTTLIADSAVFAMMARVNKVILGAHAVMANGGVIATAGAHPIAMAALHHSVPVVACAGLYKLSPLFPSGPEQFNQLLSPQPTLEEEDGSVSETLLEARFVNPTYDYVPPELISLLLTNIGGNHPSYVYRLVQEYYHPDDSKLWGDW